MWERFSRVPGANHAHQIGIAGPQCPTNFGTSYTPARSMRNSEDILHCEENFYGSATPPALAKIIGDTNADVRSVGGS